MDVVTAGSNANIVRARQTGVEREQLADQLECSLLRNPFFGVLLSPDSR